MRLPRDISGTALIRALKKLGYEPTRQSGSHVRLTMHRGDEEHHLTIPDHSPLRIGTLHSILTRVVDQSGISLEKLLELLK
ncbi:MAG: type II toxin-antitoxin system HicA family toxin [Candidatus Riflebacteria bacterium]|nr:type II toxin-antitoxin system HicA family toxin [Candidatus Riflebacteria bacterium]